MSDVFPLNSRYNGVPQLRVTLADGREVTCLGRRIIPDMARYRPMAHHGCVEGDRADQVSAGGYGDPLLYWRIADASGGDDTAELTKPLGRRLMVPLPLEVADNG